MRLEPEQTIKPDVTEFLDTTDGLVRPTAQFVANTPIVDCGEEDLVSVSVFGGDSRLLLEGVEDGDENVRDDVEIESGVLWLWVNHRRCIGTLMHREEDRLEHVELQFGEVCIELDFVADYPGDGDFRDRPATWVYEVDSFIL